VLIYRVPRGLSIVKPPSHCPACGSPVRPRDNIPLVGYLVLRGRCRDCGSPIPVSYFLVELAMGAMFVAVFARFGFRWDAMLPLTLFMVAVTLTVGVIDMKEMIIPNRIIIPSLLAAMVAVGVIALVRQDSRFLLDQGAGLLVGAVPLGLIALVFPRGMGMGDAKLMAFTGTVLAWKVLPALFLGFLLGTLASLVPLLAGKKGWKDRIPFGPFLVLGCWISVFWGDRIIALYRSFLRG
jgi:leader peptidase (prepilin peptidase)/N-methyltransferase